MTEKRRVIVTENGPTGKSAVLEDKQIELSGAGVFNFWQTFPGRSPDDVTGQGLHLSRSFLMPAGRNFACLRFRRQMPR